MPRGVELSFTVTVIVTLLAIAMLLIFFVSAIPLIDFGKYAMNIGADPSDRERPSSCLTAMGRSCPSASMASSLPFPLRCGSISPSRKFRLRPRSRRTPKRDMPRGIMLGMFTLIALGFLVLIINPAIPIAARIDRRRRRDDDRTWRLRPRHLGRTDP